VWLLDASKPVAARVAVKGPRSYALREPAGGFDCSGPGRAIPKTKSLKSSNSFNKSWQIKRKKK